MDETLCLGIDEALGEEDEVVDASYMREEATYNQEEEHLAEG